MTIQLNFEIKKGERYWEQIARLNWLKFGDRNTAFFHNSASQRQRNNRIHKLQNYVGGEVENWHELQAVARSYFIDLFRARGSGNCDHVLSAIDCCVS